MLSSHSLPSYGYISVALWWVLLRTYCAVQAPGQLFTREFGVNYAMTPWGSQVLGPTERSSRHSRPRPDGNMGTH